LVLLNAQRRLRNEIKLRKLAEEEVHQLAFYDSLTGLPNRNSFIPFANQKLLAAKNSGEHLALCYIDLNHFKQINDRFGHQAGDAILTHVAMAIKSNIREFEIAARMGGDEFVVLLDGAHHRGDIQRITHEICKAVDLPIPWKNSQINVSASLGVAWYPEDGEGLDDLIFKADTAMFQAKPVSLCRPEATCVLPLRKDFVVGNQCATGVCACVVLRMTLLASAVD
jgi:diguanylate cyclase (GGDEF)-like protein